MESSLTSEEYACYNVILNRFKAVFCAEPCIYNQTTATITCGEEAFTLKEESLITPGWQQYIPSDKKDRLLPDLAEGQQVKTDFAPAEAQTRPPKHHTVESLGKWMQNPFRQEDDAVDTDDEYKNILAGLEIGTEATRAGILKKAQDKGYIELKKTTYHILSRGVFLIESCQALSIDMSKEKTAEMGRLIKQVYKGETSILEVLALTRKEVTDIIASDQKAMQDPSNIKENLGRCPRCGKPVYENAKAYGCSGYQSGCNFTIWKSIAGKKISAAQAKTILAGKPTATLKGFKSTTSGKEFPLPSDSTRPRPALSSFSKMPKQNVNP